MIAPSPRILVDHLQEDCGGNPHLSLLYDSLASRYTVDTNGWRYRSTGVWDILHLNWPEWLVDHGADDTTQQMQVREVISEVARLKSQGTKVVWTAHNLKPHDPGPAGTFVDMHMQLSQMIDQVHVTSQSGITDVIRMYPQLRQADFRIVPLIDCASVYRKAHEAHFGSLTAVAKKTDQVSLLVFGHVRRDRCIPEFLEVVAKLRPAPSVMVAGQCGDEELQEVVQQAIDEYPGGNATSRFGRVRDDEVLGLFSRSLLTVIPSPAATNSGVALLSLHLGVPTLVPANPAFLAMRDDCGSDWVKIYGNQLNAKDVESALGSLPTRALDHNALGRHSQEAVVDSFWEGLSDLLM